MRHSAALAGVAALTMVACSQHSAPHRPTSSPEKVCLRDAAALKIAPDVCEGLPTPNWKGWTRLSPTVIRDAFPPNEHHSDCWLWPADTSIILCTDGAVATS
jgi:hypothetical protein